MLATLGTGLVALTIAVNATEGTKRSGAPCDETASAWIAVQFSSTGWDDGARDAIITDLRAGMAKEDFALCPVLLASPESATASISFAGDVDRDAHVRLYVYSLEFNVDQKRRLELSEYPESARTSAISLAADGLLRAHWAEVLNARDEIIRKPTRRVARDAPTTPPGSTPEVPTFAVIARFDQASYALGHNNFGGSGALRYWVAPRFGLEVGLGGGRGVREESFSGVIDSSVLLSSASVAFALVPRDGRALSLHAQLGGGAARVRFVGRSAVGGFEADERGWVPLARASLAAGWGFTTWLRPEIRVGLGVPFSVFGATDGTTEVTAVGGLEVSTSLGLLLEF
ncbi:MAG: hypothetical protein AAGI01_01195 [Myxococcota bacterium]